MSTARTSSPPSPARSPPAGLLPEFYFFSVNEVPCLQKEEDHAAQELTGGGDAMPLHEGGDTLRADGVRADTHQTLPAEVLQRAALYPEHAVSDTTEVLRDMVTGTVPTSSSAAAVSIPSTLMRWAAAVSFRNTYW